MEDYKPNSNAYKEAQKREAAEREKAKPPVQLTGAVKVKQKSELAKFASAFISEDIKNIKTYLLNDVLVPTLKKTLLKIVDITFNGGNVSDNRRSSSDKVSYRSYYDEPRDRDRRNDSRSRYRFDTDEIKFDYREDAEAVLKRMEDILYEYNFVTVAALYDAVDMTCPATAYDYGWDNLDGARTVDTRDGWVIDFPRMIPRRR